MIEIDRRGELKISGISFGIHALLTGRGSLRCNHFHRKHFPAGMSKTASSRGAHGWKEESERERQCVKRCELKLVGEFRSLIYFHWNILREVFFPRCSSLKTRAPRRKVLILLLSANNCANFSLQRCDFVIIFNQVHLKFHDTITPYFLWRK